MGLKLDRLIERTAKKMPTDVAIRFVATYLICHKDAGDSLWAMGSKLWCYHIDYKIIEHKALLEKHTIRMLNAQKSKIYDKEKERYYRFAIAFDEFEHPIQKPHIP